MINNLPKILLFIIILLASNSYAIKLDNLYMVELTAIDQTEVTRQELFLQAFQQILAKLTGEATTFALIQDKYRQVPIDKYVTSFTYINTGTDNVQLKIIFNEEMINNLLYKAKISYLGKERPIILTILLRKQNNDYALINDSYKENLISQLEQVAAQHAIPLVFPLLDLAEREQLVKMEFGDKLSPLLQEIALKYNAEHILIGKLTADATGWQGQWNIFANHTAIWQSTASTIVELYAKLMMLLREYLSNNNPIVLDPRVSDIDAIDEIYIQVSGINNIENYAKVLTYLRGLAIANEVKVLKVTQDFVVFAVPIVNGGLEAIKKKIHFDQVLLASFVETNSELEYGARAEFSSQLDSEYKPEFIEENPMMANVLHYRIKQ